MNRDLSGALRTALNILDVWQISLADRLLLLGCTQETYEVWTRTRKLGDLNPGTLERLSYLLGIWKALVILYSEPEIGRSWILRPNAAPEFGGRTPLSVMAQYDIDGLREVRRFLDHGLD